MRETRTSGSMSGRWKRSKAYGAKPRKGNPDTRKYRCLNYRATSRLYSDMPTLIHPFAAATTFFAASARPFAV
jgi:hypothetical protein